jgi:hypothetical protein
MAKAASKRNRSGPRAARFPLLRALAAVIAIWAVWAAPASAATVYRAAPSGAVAAAPSLGLESGGIAELGSLVQLAGDARANPTVGLGLDVWACEQGSWDGGCSTAPGATFSVPITVAVYAVGPEGVPGALLARRTQSFTLPYRPSSSCTDAAGHPYGFVAADESCSDGLPQEVSFSLPGVTLPGEAIVTVAYDTRSNGYAPTGTGTPADALNVALGATLLGGAPRAAEGAYAALGTGAGADALAFRGGGPWPARQPAIRIDAESPAAAATPAVTSAPAPAPAAAAAPGFRFPRGESLALKRKMKVSFPTRTARIGGPGALVQAKCTGSSAARCIGTLSLSVGGVTHKVPYSISKNRRQYLVVPLGDELERISSLRAPRAVVTARTVQSSGAALKTSRVLKLK